MLYVDWQPKIKLESPIYVDANILVGTTISNHPLYTFCVQLTANILMEKALILISMVSLDECMWATAKLAYCELMNLPSRTFWSKKVYLKWCNEIFQQYGHWINSVNNMLKDWRGAGVTINITPKTDSQFDKILDLAPSYMKQFKLSPADALHLAIAQESAKTFVTADSDFEILHKHPPVGDLMIIQMPKVTI